MKNDWSSWMEGTQSFDQQKLFSKKENNKFDSISAA
jgi:hypothetical protein